jgi:hypothetical protein
VAVLVLVPWNNIFTLSYLSLCCPRSRGKYSPNALAGILIIKHYQCNNSLKFGHLKLAKHKPQEGCLYLPWFLGSKNEIYPFYCHAAQGAKESTATNALAGILIIKLCQCNNSLKFGQLKSHLSWQNISPRKDVFTCLGSLEQQIYFILTRSQGKYCHKYSGWHSDYQTSPM